MTELCAAVTNFNYFQMIGEAIIALKYKDWTTLLVDLLDCSSHSYVYDISSLVSTFCASRWQSLKNVSQNRMLLGKAGLQLQDCTFSCTLPGNMCLPTD